jgi:hypothetical protein
MGTTGQFSVTSTGPSSGPGSVSNVPTYAGPNTGNSGSHSNTGNVVPNTGNTGTYQNTGNVGYPHQTGHNTGNMGHMGTGQPPVTGNTPDPSTNNPSNAPNQHKRSPSSVDSSSPPPLPPKNCTFPRNFH